MDPIGITQPLILPAPAQPVLPAAASALPALPDSSQATVQIPDQGGFDAQQAEQSRVQTVQRLAQQIANVFVIGDQTFSIFKDSTGQLITRFHSLRDGRVTYIPEPTLFKLSGNSGSGPAPVIKIQA